MDTRRFKCSDNNHKITEVYRTLIKVYAGLKRYTANPNYPTVFDFVFSAEIFCLGSLKKCIANLCMFL